MTNKKIKTPKNNIINASQAQIQSYFHWNWWLVGALTLFLASAFLFDYDHSLFITEQSTGALVMKNIFIIIEMSLITFGVTHRTPNWKNILHIWPVALFFTACTVIMVFFNQSLYEILYNMIFTQIEGFINYAITTSKMPEISANAIYVFLINMSTALFKTTVYSLILYIWFEGMQPLFETTDWTTHSFVRKALRGFRKNFWIILQINIFFFLMIVIPFIFNYTNVIAELNGQVGNASTSSSSASELVNQVMTFLQTNQQASNFMELFLTVSLYLKIVAMVIVFDGYKKHIQIEGINWKNKKE